MKFLSYLVNFLLIMCNIFESTLGSGKNVFILLFSPLNVIHNARSNYNLMVLQSTCHNIVNHYVKFRHVRLGGGANNMKPLNWGGGQTEKIRSKISTS